MTKENTLRFGKSPEREQKIHVLTDDVHDCAQTQDLENHQQYEETSFNEEMAELQLLAQRTRNVPAFSLPITHEDAGLLWKDGDFHDWDDWLRDEIIEKYWTKYGKEWDDQPYLGMYDDLAIDLDLAYKYRIMTDTDVNSFVRPLIPKGCGLSEKEAAELQVRIGYLLTVADWSPFDEYDSPDNTLGLAVGKPWQFDDVAFCESDLFKNRYFAIVEQGPRNFVIDFKGTGDDPIDLGGLETQWDRKHIEDLIKLFDYFRTYPEAAHRSHVPDAE